jgi:hypothetical protein
VVTVLSIISVFKKNKEFVQILQIIWPTTARIGRNLLPGHGLGLIPIERNRRRNLRVRDDDTPPIGSFFAAGRHPLADIR